MKLKRHYNYFNPHTMTLQECKEQIAQEYEANLKEQIDGHPGLNHGGELPWTEEDVNDRVTKLYASEKVKEALKLAAGAALPEFYEGNIIGIDAKSILSLETELLNQIDKEK